MALIHNPDKPELEIEDLWMSLRSVLFKIERLPWRKIAAIMFD
jgi:hypothetical protein